jgi:hypothetical protein
MDPGKPESPETSIVRKYCSSSNVFLSDLMIPGVVCDLWQMIHPLGVRSKLLAIPP